MCDEKVDAHWATPLALAEHSRKIQRCHTERTIVMLSVAKHLAADRERPFAALRVTTMGSSRGDNTVMLSVAKHLGTPRTRPFATLRVTTEGANTGDTGRKQHG